MTNALREITAEPFVNVVEFGPDAYTVSVIYLWGEVWRRSVFGAAELKRTKEEAQAFVKEMQSKYA